MSSQSPFIASAVLAAAAIGFFAGEKYAASDRPARVVRIAQTGPASLQDARPSAATRIDVFCDDVTTRCAELAGKPPSPRRNEALKAALETMAHDDAMAALRIAETEPNRRLRAEFITAALHGWGATAADQAAEWVLSQRDSGNAAERLLAVFEGAATQPTTAASLATKLVAGHPDQARDIGDALIYSLGKQGNFADAASFAATGSGPLHLAWTMAAYANWGNYQPQTAAMAALQLDNATARTAALDAILGNWAANDPNGLASFALTTLPVGEQRTHAVSNALIHWSADDPVAAAEWICRAGGTPECDQGEAAIATHQDVLRAPSLALHWASVITDPVLRSQTLASILQSWASRDPIEARRFAQSTVDLLPTDRAAVLAQLSSPP